MPVVSPIRFEFDAGGRVLIVQLETDHEGFGSEVRTVAAGRELLTNLVFGRAPGQAVAAQVRELVQQHRAATGGVELRPQRGGKHEPLPGQRLAAEPVQPLSKRTTLPWAATCRRTRSRPWAGSKI